MPVKKSIFGSKGEERGFRSIEHTWGENYRLVPQFPFSAIFEPDNSIRDKANLFLKTSIGYVFCSDDGAPLLALDFDGLGQGFNKDGHYVQVEKTDDLYRKSKFDFKIQYAEKNNFPYYIVASDEFEHLGEDISLTIVDGIIGSVLSMRDFYEQLPFVIEEQSDFVDTLPPPRKARRYPRLSDRPRIRI